MTKIIKIVSFAFITGALLCSNAFARFSVLPYIQNTTATSVTICWETDEIQESLVKYGTGKNVSYQYSAEGPQGKKHRVAIKNLKPGTLYYYQVLSGKDVIPAGNRDFYFNTASRAGEPFVFAVYGDTRNGLNSYDTDHEAVINSIMKFSAPQFCLVTGDLVDKGSDTFLWENFLRIENSITRHAVIYPTYGSNDLSKGKDTYDNYFVLPNGGKWYSFDWGGCHFIGLYAWDTFAQSKKELSPDSEQYKWLVKDLESETNKKALFTVVFMHDAIYQYGKPKNTNLEKYWVPLFKKYGVDTVYCSGAHLYEHTVIDGIHYVISGGGGAEMQSNYATGDTTNVIYEFHHCKVSVNPPVLKSEAINVNGNVLDSFILVSNFAEKGSENSNSSLGLSGNSNSSERIEIIEGALVQDDNKPIKLALFSTDCVYCHEIENTTLPALAKKLNIDLELHVFPLRDRGNFEKLVILENEYNDHDNPVPAVFLGGKILGGEKEIKQNLENLLIDLKEMPPETREARTDLKISEKSYDAENNIVQRFKSFSLLPIMVAGLIDGINPCAFATIIFLLSYLAILRKSKQELILAGIVFTFAVFITYFAVGLGGFSFFRAMSSYQLISKILRYLIIGLVFTLGILSLIDYYKCLKGKASEMFLQLPKNLKDRIHGQIRNYAATGGLLASTLVLGFLVSLFELACTGQIYLPTLQYMAGLSQYRGAAIKYLFLYNIMFILPLAIIFIFTVFGTTSSGFLRFFEKKVALIKLLTAILFLLLGIILLN
ncbi:MAG: hypothetical protein A3J83_00895 [Elusimicrobia bacterium RIFOXYA2_FULL_40_6]|nr:MAG: hypothetical protein A3J83_00895 [Elusimicrobia bacterium RIFOXYA2_FULL_40_6]